MADEPKPGETLPAPDPPIVPDPAVTPPETTPPATPAEPDPSEPMVETKRLTGAIQKIQTLTEEMKSKNLELAALNSLIEQDKLQQAVKAAETQAGYGERDKQLEAALKSKVEVEAETALLKGKLKKMEIAKELGHPELISIIDTIPTFEDDDLQKKAMEDILSFSDQRVQAREESLLAGITPTVSPTQPVGDGQPATNEAWEASINAEQDPTKRTVMFDDWWEWRLKNDPAKQK